MAKMGKTFFLPFLVKKREFENKIKTDEGVQAQKIISSNLQLTSICGISIKGLSAKYAYNALKTAYIKINKIRLRSYSPKDEYQRKVGSSHI